MINLNVFIDLKSAFVAPLSSLRTWTSSFLSLEGLFPFRQLPESHRSEFWGFVIKISWVISDLSTWLMKEVIHLFSFHWYTPACGAILGTFCGCQSAECQPADFTAGAVAQLCLERSPSGCAPSLLFSGELQADSAWGGQACWRLPVINDVEHT